MGTKTFPGFPRQMQVFFRNLEKNNNREFFTPRKAIFDEQVRAPMIELVTQINHDLQAFAPHNAVAEPARAIYRIYRDTRFSRDKTPYKTHIGATFGRSGLPRHGGAGFYFGVSHRCVEVAGGVYMPGPDELAALRKAIAQDASTFLTLIGDRSLVKKMGELMGQKLARLPRTCQQYAGCEAEKYLCFRQMYWFVELPAKVALSGAIRRQIVDRFRVMATAIDWMNQAILAGQAHAQEERPRRPDPMW